jgi:hypothetical protein
MTRWQREDYLNSKLDERQVERLFSKAYQDKMWDRHGFELERFRLGNLPPRERMASNPHIWRQFECQQQQTGFSFSGAATTIPAAVIWWSSAYNAATVYPAGVGGQPLYNSFIQYQGSVYAIPGATPSTAGTPPPGGVWVLQNPAAGANAWNVNPNTRQFSVWAQPTSFFPTWPPGTVDVVDAYWSPPENQVLAAGATNYYIPAPGRGFLSTATAQGTLQYNLAGTWTAGLALAATTFNWIEVDGLCWRLLSTATLNPAVTFLRTRQSVANPG